MTALMRKLPIGIQTFSKIREGDYLYVDKTDMALDLVERGSYYFLSRPRRFGKSLFISTLQALFEGRRELFVGLAAEKRWDWDTTHPVIKLSFAGVARSVAEMRQDIENILAENEERLGLQCKKTSDLGGCLRELIKESCRKYGRKVVVLVDEYDKLILDNLDQVAVAAEARELLKDLYTTIKDSDEYIKFAFLTGVSRFARVSIFSGLNNLEDISLNPDYATICGYTQRDLETVFADHLRGADMDRVREWYNGYRFLGEPVYNPFDILLFLKNNHRFDNYWFATGTPSFLVKLIRENDYFLPRLTDLWVSSSIVDSFDIEDIRLEPIMFQAGYLTIKEARELPFGGYEYLLGVPNKEVAISLHDTLIRYLTNETRFSTTKSAIYAALASGDPEGLRKALTALFASIPYTNYVNNVISSYEGYFASVVYAYLASLGVEITAEDVTNRGRIDLTVRLNGNIYVIEFKVDGGGKALEQVRERGYHQKYLGRGTVFLVGIDFSSTAKNIAGFAWEKIPG